jgi:hypothetical protein
MDDLVSNEMSQDLGQPVLHLQTANTSELIGIGGRDRSADRRGVSRNQEIIPTDQPSRVF